jgi:hypothetical protein
MKRVTSYVLSRFFAIAACRSSSLHYLLLLNSVSLYLKFSFFVNAASSQVVYPRVPQSGVSLPQYVGVPRVNAGDLVTSTRANYFGIALLCI